MPIFTGVYKDYEWLETEHLLEDVITLCPRIVMSRYLAVTAVDSGVFHPVEEGKVSGWECDGGISYSPRVESIESLPKDVFCRYSEWYIYDKATRKGALCSANPFETEMAPPNIFAFVNYLSFRPSDDGVGPLFWRQIEWTQPVAYISDGHEYLVFASRDKSLFASVLDALEKHPLEESGP